MLVGRMCVCGTVSASAATATGEIKHALIFGRHERSSSIREMPEILVGCDAYSTHNVRILLITHVCVFQCMYTTHKKTERKKTWSKFPNKYKLALRLAALHHSASAHSKPHRAAHILKLCARARRDRVRARASISNLSVVNKSFRRG